ncbi:phosphate signaling complex PhoU family protein [Egicoccus halophilus]|uniref:Phosphate transport system regulatory protein PhoU n=1 Tax=Egicoccus halophilus TaxID=1670830 RepID=A0A8J3EZ13_9ACTN|nr:PhoU domain-containing protein [Egicoccus halophilus]GGI08955.1 phosphate transport system regulatory protein PhoU [Egicoccus halophilus]
MVKGQAGQRPTRREASLAARLRDIVMPPFPEPTGPVRAGFQEWLDEIDDELISSALTLVDALPRAVRALLHADHGAVDELRVATYDVQGRCRHVEEQGFLLLAREAPVAGDLRRLVGILRLILSVDRTAALVRHVAEATDHVDATRMPQEIRTTLEDFAARTVEVLRRGIDAWRQRDGLAVHEVNQLDESVDHLQVHLLAEVREQVTDPAELVLLGLLARYLERIADHGVAFAQHACFAVTGERVDVGRLEP